MAISCYQSHDPSIAAWCADLSTRISYLRIAVVAYPPDVIATSSTEHEQQGSHMHLVSHAEASTTMGSSHQKDGEFAR